LWPAAIALVVVVLLIPALVLPLPTDTALLADLRLPADEDGRVRAGNAAGPDRARRPVAEHRARPSMALCVAGYWLSAYLPGTFGYVAATVIPISLLVGSPRSPMSTAPGRRGGTAGASGSAEISFAFPAAPDRPALRGPRLFTCPRCRPQPRWADCGLSGRHVGAALLLFNTVETTHDAIATGSAMTSVVIPAHTRRPCSDAA